jgi:hypothetical protein
VAARAGFRVGDFILSIDGEQAGFVWDSLRKLTAAGKSSVLLEVQRGNEVLRGELMAPEGELLTSSNTGLFFEIPEGYRFIGENDRRELRNGFSRAYMEGLAGDERLAYATSLALLGGNLVKRGVEQADLKPSDTMWLKTEQILGDHHGKFSKALAHHGVVLESMQANLQAGFVKIGALLLAALIAGIAALAAALQLNKHLSEQGLGALKAQFQGLRSQMDQLAHAQAAMSTSGRETSATGRSSARSHAAASMRSNEVASDQNREAENRAMAMGSAVVAGAAVAAGMSLAELAARVALSSDADEDKADNETSDSDEGQSDNAPSSATNNPASNATSDASSNTTSDASSSAGSDEGHTVLVDVDAMGDADATGSQDAGMAAPSPVAEQSESAGGQSNAAQSSDTHTEGGQAPSDQAQGLAIAVPASEGLAQADAPGSGQIQATTQASEQADGADRALNANTSRTGDGASA